MRRYGDNVTPEEEETPGAGELRRPQVIYGGCGWGAGSFSQNRRPARKPRRSVMSALRRLWMRITGSQS